MQGTIEEVAFLGSVVRIRVRFGENAVLLDTFNNPGVAPPARGAKAVVSFGRDDLLAPRGCRGELELHPHAGECRDEAVVVCRTIVVPVGADAEIDLRLVVVEILDDEGAPRPTLGTQRC